MSAGRREGWRWNPSRHAYPAKATITVSDPSKEQQAEREKKIREGARILPFGFARVLVEDEIDHHQPPEPPEPLTWEGDCA